MPAPGVTPPPGIQQAQNPLPGRPVGLPPNFQPPAGIPANINFNAAVIRMGTTGSGRPSAQETSGSRRESAAEPMSAGGRRGLGMGRDYGANEQQRQQMRETLMALQPPTREEIARTIFIGNITEGVGGDEGMERILRTAGNLRRWNRASDADNKPCKFGFAEYEDAESLETAAEIFKDIQVPVKRQEPNQENRKSHDEVEKATLLVVVDEASMKYAEEWKLRRDEDESAAHFRIDTAKETLSSVLASLFNPQALTRIDTDGDIAMQDGKVHPDGNSVEVVTIPLSVEDELSDIPADMRETVAAEIAAFRDRSNRRDLERLRREEEMEAAERARNMAGPRVNRLGSPPPTAPSGPAGGANGIPLGPRDRGVQGAPSGPKGFKGAQIPSDYQSGVAFINGSGVNGTTTSSWLSREDEDDSASDSELEKRRQEKKEAEIEKLYLDYERRWLNRERSRAAALEREKNRDKDEEGTAEKERDAVAKRLKEWDDDIEAARKVEEYYQDRSLWNRNRAAFRAREAAADNLDRENEERELARESQKREDARGMADSFLARQAEELESRAQTPREPARFKLSLGAAAQKVHAAAAPRRTAAEVEALLEDEEENETTIKRTLIPIKFDTAAEAASLTEEERQQAVRQLASDIPTDKEGLWKWDVRWDFVDDIVLSEKLKPFVEKKIVEYLGVQEQMLVDVVDQHLRKRGNPDDLVAELEMALDEEAEILVKKLWRMLIFYSESEKRGIGS